jgi:hypothetical protein
MIDGHLRSIGYDKMSFGAELAQYLQEPDAVDAPDAPGFRRSVALVTPCRSPQSRSFTIAVQRR